MQGTPGLRTTRRSTWAHPPLPTGRCRRRREGYQPRSECGSVRRFPPTEEVTLAERLASLGDDGSGAGRCTHSVHTARMRGAGGGASPPPTITRTREGLRTNDHSGERWITTVAGKVSTP